MTVSIEDILAEIDRLNLADKDGFTRQDLEDATGRSGKWCLSTIARLMREGRAKYVGTKRSTTIDGRVCYVPVYNLIDL